MADYEVPQRTYAAAGPALAQWLALRADIADRRLHLPVGLAARRLGLADQRCVELGQQLEDLRTRLLNLPGGASFVEQSSLEERLLRTEQELHQERLALWKDLLPLVTTARDAIVEQMRSALLDELMRTDRTSGDRR